MRRNLPRLAWIGLPLLLLVACQTWTPSTPWTAPGTALPVRAAQAPAEQGGSPAGPAQGPATRVYPLGPLGADAGLARWLAETIPSVVEPESWKARGGPGVLTHHPAGNLLVVHHSAAVQAKVEAFLRDVQRGLAGRGEAAAPAGVVQAGAAPGRLPEAALGYPVPAAVRPPKHLFHFIIRYEGEGIVDANVVDLVKAQQEMAGNAAALVPVPAAAPVVSSSPAPGTAVSGATAPAGALQPAPDGAVVPQSFPQPMQNLPPATAGPAPTALSPAPSTAAGTATLPGSGTSVRSMPPAEE